MLPHQSWLLIWHSDMHTTTCHVRQRSAFSRRSPDCVSCCAAQTVAPLPRHINPGYYAWANGGMSPFIYVMKCNPQHYYLLHEMGHRLGMPHATIYQRDQGNANAVPVPALGAGLVTDSYSDKLDIMACCKGDYSLYNR